MRLNAFFAVPLVAALLSSCGGGLPPGQNPEPAPSAPVAQPGIPRLGLFAIKASNGMYVSCTMTPDSAGKITLLANREKVGPNEVFTAWYDDAGHMGIRAPNGKIISVEREPGGLLVADRDYVGEWEYFELVDQGQGLFALKNSNGLFVCPHYDWPGARANQLGADRSEPYDWERFTIVQDPAIGQ
jgi:hypothetical protein